MKRKLTSDNDLAPGSGATPTPRRKTPVRVRAKHMAPAGEIAEDNTAAIIEAPVAGRIAYQPSHEEIASLAYLYWESRGGQGGSSEEDWLRAERELHLRAQAATA